MPATSNKKKKATTSHSPKKRTRRRLFSVLSLLIGLMLFFGGLIVGYAVLGDGHWWDALQWSTWRHVYDLVWSEV